MRRRVATLGSGTMLGERLGRVESVAGLNESRVEISGEEVKEEKGARPLEKETVALGPMEREARDWLEAKWVVARATTEEVPEPMGAVISVMPSVVVRVE